jgi:hypothetical protein
MDNGDQQSRFRALAHQHHEAAERLLVSDEPSTARYACLELRMALECLAYDLLRLYRNDVPDGLLETWQASAVLDALLDIDPTIEGPIEFQVAGEDGGFDKPLIAWREERMKVKWAKKAYFQLGHFLHERTFKEVERGMLNDFAKIRDRAQSISAEIAKVLSSSGWNLRLTNTSQFDCACGGHARFVLSPMQRKTRARCDTCAANYEVQPNPDDPAKILSRLMSKAT